MWFSKFVVTTFSSCNQNTVTMSSKERERFRVRETAQIQWHFNITSNFAYCAADPLIFTPAISCLYKKPSMLSRFH